MDTPSPSLDFSSYRTVLTSSQGGQRRIAASGWEILSKLELFPGCPIGTLQLEIPENWVARGYQGKFAQRFIDGTLAGMLIEKASPAAAAARTEWVGRAMLVFWLPSGSLRGAGLQAWSYRSRCKILLRAVRQSVQSMRADEYDIWPHIIKHREEDFDQITMNSRSKADLHSAVDILLRAAEEGIFPPPNLVTEMPSAKSESSYKSLGEKSKHKQVGEDIKKKPFPNKFTSEYLSRAFWLQDNIAEQAIDLFRKASEIASDASLSYDQIKPMRQKLLESTVWRDLHGEIITRLPFQIKQRADGNLFELSSRWPPEKYGSIKLVLTLVQIANLSTVAFCTAARGHEIQSMEDDEELLSTDEIQATTFKHSGRIGGRRRSWPLHPRAALAIRLQEKLASVVRQPGEKHLWVVMKDGSYEKGSPLSNVSHALKQTVEHFDLAELTEGNAHLHRWRHTVARIVGITVDRAPEVLMDLFGSDFEGVLTYLLSDPDVAAEAIRVAEETSYALGREAIEQCVSGRAGGKAATSIRSGLERTAMARGISALGTDDIDQALRMLTAANVSFRLVRRGVICTKQSGEFGPCTRRMGRPDPGSCRAECDHRLELASEKEQCHRQIEAILEMIERMQPEPMVVAHLQGQLLYELRRWDDVRAQFLSTSGIAREVWSANGG